MECLGSDYLRPQMGEALWSALSSEQRVLVSSWPAAHIRELRIRFEHLTCDLVTEIKDLDARALKNREVSPYPQSQA